MTTYRLGSNPMIHTPGIVRWAVHHYHSPSDRKYLTKVISEGWGVPVKAAKALLSGKSTYTVEGETVVFDA